MSQFLSGYNFGDVIGPAQVAARALVAATDGTCKASAIGGFWVVKKGSEFSGDAVHTFELEGQSFIIYEPDSSDS